MKKTFIIFLTFVIFFSIPINPLHASTQKVWGRIANPNHQGEKINGIFFFAGPPNPNALQFYTRTPVDEDEFKWQSDNDVNSILDQVKAVNTNVIKLSWWGSGDEYLQWAPTLSSTAVNHQLFIRAEDKDLLVSPVIEVSPTFQFWQDYPDNTSPLEEKIKSVLSTYGQYDNWLRLYDKNGQERKVIWLIETIHAGPVDEAVFAHNFDVVAESIYLQTGHKIGFVIDPTPLPANGSYAGPNPVALQQTASLLAINPFNITSDGQTETERLNKAEEILVKWQSSNIPLIVPVLPGYDDHLVRSPSQVYGDNDNWRDRVKQLAFNYETAGITLDIWNGFTEGYVFVPTRESGEANYNLAKTLFNLVAGDFNADHHVDSKDFDILVANFGKPYTIFDYNRLVENFGR